MQVHSFQTPLLIGGISPARQLQDPGSGNRGLAVSHSGHSGHSRDPWCVERAERGPLCRNGERGTRDGPPGWEPLDDCFLRFLRGSISSSEAAGVTPLLLLLLPLLLLLLNESTFKTDQVRSILLAENFDGAEGERERFGFAVPVPAGAVFPSVPLLASARVRGEGMGTECTSCK
jgi:hypothetical protein